MRVPQMIKDCNLIIDEQPDFSSDLADSTVKEMVTSYLDEIDAKIKTWEQLATILTQDIGADPDVLYEELEKPDRNWFLHGDNAHALAPGIVEAIVTAEERCHDRWVGKASYTYPDLNPTHDTPEQKVIIRIVINESCEIRLLQVVPDFSEARSVIGLDAHVTLPKWRGNTTQEIEKTEILDSGELHRWRRNERNLKIVQVGEEKYSWTNQGFSESKVNAFCKELREEYGSSFSTAITSLTFKDDLRECLVNAGVEAPETLHYGNQKSQETFDSEEVGLVAGCISPSSEQIKDWLALLERQATPRREVKDNYTGQKWVGPDSNIARAILKDVREHGVLQACGRYARSPQESDDGAVVYVMTNVVPSNYVDENIENIDVLGQKQKQILTYVFESSEGASPSEIAGNLETSRKHVHKTLNKCRECPWMEVEEGRQPNDGDIFYAERCPSGLVEL
jgi:hypothetical protein